MAFSRKRPDLTPRRCLTCGMERVPDLLNPAFPCPDHPDSDLVVWERKYQIAWDYVDRAGRQPLDDWESDPEVGRRMWPGCRYMDLWETKRLHDRWSHA